jgi:competence protein ComEC
MLSSFIVGILWGVMLGPAFFYSMWWTWWMNSMAICLGLFAMILRCWSDFFWGGSRSWRLIAMGFVCSSGFLWSFAHSPPQIRSGTQSGNVVYARGCGDQITDLLVDAGDQLYAARGQALVGDIVRSEASGHGLKTGFVAIRAPMSEPETLCHLVALVRGKALAGMSRYPKDTRDWMSAFIFGDQRQLPKSLIRDFRDIGLLHVLVLSGGHLSWIMLMIHLTLRAPFQLAYIFRSIRMDLWVRVWIFSKFFALICLSLFCFLVGFTQSIQRAYLSVCVLFFCEATGFPVKRSSQILSVLAVQAVIFPANFLSLSMLLSWSGTLILRAFYRSTFRGGWGHAMIQAVVIQAIFMAVSLLFFGSAGILSVPVNLLAMIALSAVLPLDCFALLLNWSWLDRVVILVNRATIAIISKCAVIQAALPISRLTVPNELSRDSVLGHILIAAMLVGLYVLSVTNDPVSHRAHGS